MLADMETDWYQHYLRKHFRGHLDDERAFVDFVSRHLEPGQVLIECGAGLGRSAAALVTLGGFRVIAVENDRRLRCLAEDITADLVASGNLCFVGLDARNLADFFPHQGFAACTHSGVLEHYTSQERQRYLLGQLKLAPLVLMSVPLATPHNYEYFAGSPRVFRDLRSVEDWLEEFDLWFECKEHEVARQRTDNAFFALEKKP